MRHYRCTLHNIELNKNYCDECESREHVEVTSDIYYCTHCNVPIYEEKCPVCHGQCSRIAADVRPVFPRERLLYEILEGEPLKYLHSSVWNASGNYYMTDGVLKRFNVGRLSKLSQEDIDNIREQLEKYEKANEDNSFSEYIERFISCNSARYDEITQEAVSYIQDIAAAYDVRDMFVSFSGGKDSTVTSDLVMRALSNPRILHIFGDTTLEFPKTEEYVARFKKAHPMTPVLSSRNKEKNFSELCELIGPPSRVMRWCCTIFKTGAINRKLTALFKDKTKILAFYGIRRSESASRSKYERETQGRKISKQDTVSPAIDWMDFDVWLYILKRKIDFNEAYTYGYARVGCFCCPNNSVWSEFLSKIYMPEQYGRWQEFLVEFARSIGKPDAEEYVRSGKWKARQGGNGIAYADKAVVSFTPCVLEENSFNYDLLRPVSEGLYELFKPFGYLDFNMGNARLGELYILIRRGTPLLRLQGRTGSTHLKITILDYHIDKAKSVEKAEEKVKCQLTKYQLCMGCRACEGVCRHGAIRLESMPDGSTVYHIDNEKCVRCAECVNHFNSGCYMKKVLAVKRKQI